MEPNENIDTIARTEIDTAAHETQDLKESGHQHGGPADGHGHHHGDDGHHGHHHGDGCGHKHHHHHHHDSREGEEGHCHHHGHGPGADEEHCCHHSEEGEGRHCHHHHHHGGAAGEEGHCHHHGHGREGHPHGGHGRDGAGEHRDASTSSELICPCMGTTKDDIFAAVAAGATTLEDVERATGAGTRCGRCRAAVAATVEEALAQTA